MIMQDTASQNEYINPKLILSHKLKITVLSQIIVIITPNKYPNINTINTINTIKNTPGNSISIKRSDYLGSANQWSIH